MISVETEMARLVIGRSEVQSQVYYYQVRLLWQSLMQINDLFTRQWRYKGLREDESIPARGGADLNPKSSKQAEGKRHG